MQFGRRLRELRQARRMTLRDLAAKVGVGFTYLSKIENHKLEEGHSPSEKLIHKLAVELDADEQELLFLAEKVPEVIRRRVMEQPNAFMALAQLGDADLTDVLKQVQARIKKR
jgi:HTH-type transcriptional regulator, competence development regulator